MKEEGKKIVYTKKKKKRSSALEHILIDQKYICNTPIPEKTGSCMQARLNSPPAINMADEISEERKKLECM